MRLNSICVRRLHKYVMYIGSVRVFGVYVCVIFYYRLCVNGDAKKSVKTSFFRRHFFTP